MVRVVETPPSNIQKFTTFFTKKSSYSFLILLFLVVATLITFKQLHLIQDIRQQAAYDPTTKTFTETFNGAPTTPQPFTNIMQNTIDIAVQSRDWQTYLQLEPMESQHGPDCSAPIDASGNLVTHHNDGNYDNAVFKCADHLMTSIIAGGYGVIYLTPNAMVDFSNGEAVIKVDVSTLRTSSRDWWDIWITPYDENIQLPFNMGDVDMNGEPKDSVHISNDGNANGGGTGFHPDIIKDFQSTDDFKAFSGDYNWWTGYEQFMQTSPKKRTTFELHISRTHLKFGIPAGQVDDSGKPINGGDAFWWIDKDINPLSWSQGVVQFGHHSYNPEKDCTPDPTMKSCYPDTWHWDNITISPAIPFSMIKADKRLVNVNDGGISFSTPAPANSHLRFSGVGTIQVSFDNGATYKPATKALSSGIVGVTGYHPEHMSSYWMSIPQGTTSVKFRFSADDWYNNGPYEAKDFAIWTQDPNITLFPTFTPAPPTPTPTPLPSGTTIKMGETNTLSEADNGNGNLLLTQKATLSQTATLYTLSFYVTNPSGNLRLGVYDATGPLGDPGKKVAETASFTPVNGWNTADVISPVSLPAGTYWLAYLPSDNSLAFMKVTNGTGGRYYTYNFGPLPQTFSTTTNTTSSNWSFYATLIASGTNVTTTTTPTPSTTTPTFTPTPTLSPTPTPSFTSSATGPSTVITGSSFTVNSTVTSTTAFTGNVIISLYDPNGVQKAQQQYTSQLFTSGQAKSYSTPWQLPSNSAAGLYTVKIQVTDSANTLYHYNSNALIFSVVSPTLTPTPTLIPTTGSWKGEYFNNRNLSGTPVLVRNDAAINFNWGKGSPAPQVSPDNFSVRWTKQEVFTGGAYTFTVSNDDGMIISVDGSVIYNNWKDQGAGTKRFNAGISAGTHTITVLYYEHKGYAVAKASYVMR